MSKGLKIAPNLMLPDDAVTETFALLARRGAGKTYAASVLAEEMLDKHYPIVWLDPLGVAWGLRTHYPIVIFGGKHADLVLDPKMGAKVADIIIEQRFPAILDVSEFGENEMKRFVGDFADRFYRKNRLPVHLFLDEADEFAPQNGGSGAFTAKCTGAIQNIVRRGRARGIGITMITQRSAVIHKSILSQTEGLFALQSTHPRDLKAIEEWFSYHLSDKAEQKKVMQSIPKLSQGEAYFYSPGRFSTFQKIKIRKRRTHDSSATPKLGQDGLKPKKFKEVNLEQLSKAIGISADDPDIKKKPASVDARKVSVLEQKISALEVDKANLQRRLNESDSRNKILQLFLDDVVSRSKTAELRLNDVPASKTVVKAKPVATPALEKRSDLALKTEPEEFDQLPKAQRRILTALFWLRGEETTSAKVGFYSEYKAGSGSFNNALSGLRTAGYVDGWKITEDGVAVIPLQIEERPSGLELREWLRPKLGKAPNQILDVLMENYPDRIGVHDLAVQSEYAPKSGSFNNALSKLRSLDAASGGEREGGVIASEVFFS